MKTVDLSEVFGVRIEPLLSYVDRPEIDGRLVELLKADYEIVVYGASKQGKSALIKKNLNRDGIIQVQLSPQMTTLEIYRSIVRQTGVKMVAGSSESNEREVGVTIGSKIKALIPIFAEAEAKAEGKAANKAGAITEYEHIPHDLAVAQDVIELLHRVGNKKFVVLDNFHYLSDEHQQHFAFDLRAFQEAGIRIIILGIWREKNRLLQINGDLADRVKEVSVEPWSDKDFDRVVAEGEMALNIQFDRNLIKETRSAAFGSIGVFQELLKSICQHAGIKETVQERVELTDSALLKAAIQQKAEDYSPRYFQALSSIARGLRSNKTKEGLAPLRLPYYFVRSILEMNPDEVRSGIKKQYLEDVIKSMHHRPNDVRKGDMTYMLSTLSVIQRKRQVSPVIFDYDSASETVRVLDSLFQFYLQFGNVAPLKTFLVEGGDADYDEEQSQTGESTQ